MWKHYVNSSININFYISDKWSFNRNLKARKENFKFYEKVGKYQKWYILYIITKSFLKYESSSYCKLFRTQIELRYRYRFLHIVEGHHTTKGCTTRPRIKFSTFNIWFIIAMPWKRFNLDDHLNLVDVWLFCLWFNLNVKTGLHQSN